MAFEKSIQRAVSEYVENHLPEVQFYQNYFWFISDVPLRSRLEDEFRSARYIYKLLEGLQVNGGLLVTQSKIQILLYASIYEAVLHHVLLQEYASTAEVVKLASYEHKKPINIAANILNTIQTKYNPTGKISVYENETRSVDERKIVFEDKAETARLLGLIDQSIKDAICDIYSMRNAIHLHAELRRGVSYDLDAAKKAYWHLQGFSKQIGNKLEIDGKALRPSANKGLKSRPQTKQLSWFGRINNWFKK